MTADFRALLQGTLTGTLSSERIESAVQACWAAQDPVHHLPAEALPPLPRPVGRVGRHGFTDELITEVLYGSVGQPGCLLVTTPGIGRYDRSLSRLLVPPHVHESAHIAVVVSGRPLWLVACPTASGPVLVAEPMRPGSMAFYPPGVAHTFVADEAFVVATAEARSKNPESERFARPAPLNFARLPRMTYDEWRASEGALRQRGAAVGS
jgi:hypothetical protein